MRRFTSQSKGGFREDLGLAVRSKWEANICRYFNYLKIPWQYEKYDFEFKSIKRGTRFYKPDFYLPDTDNFLEVKGFMDAKSKTKLKRFKKFYPDKAKNLQLVIYDPFSRSVENGKVMKFLLDDLDMKLNDIISYKEIKNKLSRIIPYWE